MTIICRLKKEAERIKTARNVFNSIHEPKDFIIKFELKGKFVEEKVYKEHREILENLLKISYKNRFKGLISDIAPLNFNAIIEAFLPLRERSAHDYFKRLRIGNITSYNHLLRTGFPTYSSVSENLRIPNFRLVFDEITLGLDFFIQVLQEMKNDFSKQDVDDIYRNILDEFIRITREKIKEKIGDGEISDECNCIIKLSNVSVVIYYNFDFVFSLSSNQVKLVFKNVGWDWHEKKQSQKLEFYIFGGPFMHEDILKEIFLYLVRLYPDITVEKSHKVLGYIFYKLCEYSLSYAVKNKFLNNILLDKLLEEIEKKFNELQYNPFNSSITYPLLLPKDKGFVSLSLKDKLVLYVLKDIIEKIAKNGEQMKEKLQKAFVECISKNKECLFIDIRYPEENRKIFSIYAGIYYKNANRDIVLIKIYIDSSSYLQKYHGIDIHTRHALYYDYFKDDIEKALKHSAHSLFALLETVGISKHQIDFIFKIIEFEFLHFE